MNIGEKTSTDNNGEVHRRVLEATPHWRIVDALAWTLGRDPMTITPDTISATAYGKASNAHSFAGKSEHSGWQLDKASLKLRENLAYVRKQLRDGGFVSYLVGDDQQEQTIHPIYWQDTHLRGEPAYFDKRLFVRASEFREAWSRLQGEGKPPPFSDAERQEWIRSYPDRNGGDAHRAYRKEARFDGTKQRQFRDEWKEIRQSRRGRPPNEKTA
jgi:hypothetical protein